MDKSFVTLNLGGQKYDYIYYPKTRTVCTPEFPDIPIEKVYLKCAHSLKHDTVRDIIEERQKVLEKLAQLF